MYAFFVLPLLFILAASIWGFGAYMKRRSSTHPEEHVAVDKPPQKMLPQWYRDKVK